MWTGDKDFDLEYHIKGTKYKTAGLLYNIGADSPCGQGTWVFRVSDPNSGGIRVIKDCWIENREGRKFEGDIVKEIKSIMGNEEFSKYFVDIVEDNKAELPEPFGRICKILAEEKVELSGRLTHSPLEPCPSGPKPTYSSPSSVMHLNQSHPSGQSTHQQPSNSVPHPRTRYQVLYCEEGVPLYDASSLEDVFKFLIQIVDGTRRDSQLERPLMIEPRVIFHAQSGMGASGS